MKCADLVKINRISMELMSKHDIRQSDYAFIELYEEYLVMRDRGDKYNYIIAVLSERYNISDSTVKRIVRRLSKEVNM